MKDRLHCKEEILKLISIMSHCLKTKLKQKLVTQAMKFSKQYKNDKKEKHLLSNISLLWLRLLTSPRTDRAGDDMSHSDDGCRLALSSSSQLDRDGVSMSLE